MTPTLRGNHTESRADPLPGALVGWRALGPHRPESTEDLLAGLGAERALMALEVRAATGGTARGRFDLDEIVVLYKSNGAWAFHLYLDADGGRQHTIISRRYALEIIAEQKRKAVAA